MAATDTLASVGESAALARIVARLPPSDSALLGPGDDAAVVKAADGRFVVTTDMMVEGPDFSLAWSTPEDLGWKAAASNLSDVAAMGAVPTALLVALAAPAVTPVAVLEGIADGFREACAALAPGCGVVGGDLSVSPVMTFAITAFGDLGGRAPVLRSGARPGDVVAVSGPLGHAAAGLRILFERGVDADGRPDAARARSLRSDPETAGLVMAQLRPQPPVAGGVAAALAGASAMLDLSDGLAKDAARVAKASAVTVNFARSLLGDDPDGALAGGEDHSLLATFPPNTVLPSGFRPVGRVVGREDAHVTLDGYPVSTAGWDPYTDWRGASDGPLDAR